MPLNYEQRIEQLKAIMNDLEPILDGEYTREKGFAVAFVFNNLFEETWKHMSTILKNYYGYSNEDPSVKSPKNVIKTSLEVGLIDTDRWLKILLDRNNTTHDYRNQNIEFYFNQIKTEYYDYIKKLILKSESLLYLDNDGKETSNSNRDNRKKRKSR